MRPSLQRKTKPKINPFLLALLIFTLGFSAGYKFLEFTQNFSVQTFTAQLVQAKNFASDLLQSDKQDTQQAASKRGVYIHMNNVANKNTFDSEIERLKKHRGDTLVIDVKGDLVYFPTSSKLAQEYRMAKPLYELPEILAKLKEQGIYTVARFIVCKNPSLAFRMKEAQLKNYKGENMGDIWMNPVHPLTLAYNREIIEEVAGMGVDEINLDFIRYPTEFQNDYLGLSSEEKITNIETFIKMARQAIDSQSKQTKLSINTFAILAWEYDENAGVLGQDVKSLAKYVDIIAPMLYPSTFSEDNPWYHEKGKSFAYSTVYLTLKKYQTLLGDDAEKLRPWIQGYYTTTANMLDQMQAVFDSGICGFTVWDIKNDYISTYKALDQIQIPESCQN